MRRNTTRLVVYGLLTLSMMVLIFILSDQDGTESGGLSQWLLNTGFGRMLLKILPPITDAGASVDIRKYAHITEYMVLACFAALFFKEMWLERIPLKALVASALLGFLYACSDEFHQTFIPGRSGQLSDVMIDMSGVLIGILFVFLVSILRKESA